MKTATSADGTKLAYDQFGAGSRVIMISGAFNDRRTTEPLSRALAERFSVFNYDRRGRGDSGDTVTPRDHGTTWAAVITPVAWYGITRSIDWPSPTRGVCVDG